MSGKYNKYLLSGLLVCGQCGSTMKGVKGSDQYYYYACTGRVSNKNNCEQKFLRMYEIDEIVIHLINEKVEQELELIKNGKKVSVEREIEITKVKINEMFEMSNVRERYYKLLYEELNKYESLITKMKDQLTQNITFDKYTKSLNEWKSLDLNKCDTEILRKIMKKFINSITIKDDIFIINLKF